MAFRTVLSKLGKKVKVPVEKADPRPVEIPTELKRPETTDERIRRIIQEQISPHAVEMGYESADESEDFDVEDEDDNFGGELPLTQSEFLEMEIEHPEVREILSQAGSPIEPDEDSQGRNDTAPAESGKEIDESNTNEVVDSGSESAGDNVSR